MRRLVLLSPFLLLLICLCAGNAWSGTTGKLTGVVVDQSGEPLPGANVVIKELRRGASADSEGRYFILSVDPGTYRVEASLVGYQSIAQEDVKMIVDFTTTVSFRLEEMTLEGAEIVVVAERPLVEPDKTSTKYVVTSEEIEALPMVRSASDFAELQGGVSVDGNWTIRGGDAPDAAVIIDGVRIVNNDLGGFNRFMGVNTNAIQELQVITGGMEAEYGNAQAGIIRIVTRDGSNTLRGLAEYRSTPPSKKHWGPNVYEHPTVLQQDIPDNANLLDYTSISGHEVDLNLSGPLVGGLQFFASTKWDGRAPTFPGPTTRMPWNTQNHMKLIQQVNPNLKVRVGGLFERHKGYSGDSRGVGSSFRNLFLPDDFATAGHRWNQEDLIYVSATHTITSRTFYEMRFSRSHSSIETENGPEATTKWTRNGYFNMDRAFFRPEDSERTRWNLKADLSSQITRSNLIKAGLDVTYYNVWWTWIQHSTEANRTIRFIGQDHTIGEGVQPLEIALYLQDRIEFEGIVLNAGIRLDRFDFRRDEPHPYLWGTTPMYVGLLRYRNAPTEPAEPMIRWSPRLGISHPITEKSTLRFFYGKFTQPLRFDHWYQEEWDSGTTDDRNGDGVVQDYEWGSGYVKTQGLLHGHSAFAPYEQTTSFEVGLDWNFVSDYVLNLTTYYKSAIDQSRAGSQTNYRDPLKNGKNIVGPSHRMAGYSEDSRGFEVSLKKRFSHHFAFQVAYNVQWATEDQSGWRGASAFPDSLFMASGLFWRQHTYDPNTGLETPVPMPESEIVKFGSQANKTLRSWQAGEISLAPFRKSFPDLMYEAPNGGKMWLFMTLSGGRESRPRVNADQRAFGSIQVLVSTPADFGPTIGKINPLGNWRSNIIYRLDTGTPFQYSPPDGPTVWANSPLRTRADMSLERSFQLGNRYEAIFYTEIRNLFNTQDLRNNNQFDNNQPPFDWMQWGLTTPRPGNAKFEQYGDERVLNRYMGAPRHLVLGWRVKF